MYNITPSYTCFPTHRLVWWSQAALHPFRVGLIEAQVLKQLATFVQSVAKLGSDSQSAFPLLLPSSTPLVSANASLHRKHVFPRRVKKELGLRNLTGLDRNPEGHFVGPLGSKSTKVTIFASLILLLVILCHCRSGPPFPTALPGKECVCLLFCSYYIIWRFCKTFIRKEQFKSLLAWKL